jgi:hypothetical protein
VVVSECEEDTEAIDVLDSVGEDVSVIVSDDDSVVVNEAERVSEGDAECVTESVAVIEASEDLVLDVVRLRDGEDDGEVVTVVPLVALGESEAVTDVDDVLEREFVDVGVTVFDSDLDTVKTSEALVESVGEVLLLSDSVVVMEISFDKDCVAVRVLLLVHEGDMLRVAVRDSD